LVRVAASHLPTTIATRPRVSLLLHRQSNRIRPLRVKRIPQLLQHVDQLTALLLHIRLISIPDKVEVQFSGVWVLSGLSRISVLIHRQVERFFFFEMIEVLV